MDVLFILVWIMFIAAAYRLMTLCGRLMEKR